MMKRFLTLNDLLHEQGLSAAALAEIRTLGLKEMDSQSDWRCHKKSPPQRAFCIICRSPAGGRHDTVSSQAKLLLNLGKTKQKRNDRHDLRSLRLFIKLSHGKRRKPPPSCLEKTQSSCSST